MHIFPFQPLVPTSNQAAEAITCPPYDALPTCIDKDPCEMNVPVPTFLSVIRPEVPLLSPLGDPSSTSVQHIHAARAALYAMQDAGYLTREREPAMYVYEMTSTTLTQRGVVATVRVADYDQGRIRRHENTHDDKQQACTRLMDGLSANATPVFLTYRAVDDIDALIFQVVNSQPRLYCVKSPNDAFIHAVYRIPPSVTRMLQHHFDINVPHAYIADGHHRAASASMLADAKNLKSTARFSVALFPHTTLGLTSFHRVVTDLPRIYFQNENYHTETHTPTEALVKRVGQIADVTPLASTPLLPPSIDRNVHMYAGGRWYDVVLPSPRNPSPVENLDCTVLQDAVLTGALGIGEGGYGGRLSFMNGTAGAAAVSTKVDAYGDDIACAFMMHAVSVDDVMRIADGGEVMPPKSTCFEPKLRCGFFTHTF